MTRSTSLRALGALLLLGLALPALAQTSPVGTWRTIDDETGQPKSIVRVTLENGELIGRIERLLPEGRVCSECPGQYSGSNLRGVRVLWGFRQNGNEWTGGRAFDPGKDRTYRGVIRVERDGRLYLRGYVGVRALGRSQHWERVR
jgi:uncharacterized protein (DUF2147 family)